MPKKDPEARQSPWNEFLEADLRSMSAAGKSASEIAAFLNDKYRRSLSRSAIIGKRMRIGLCKPMQHVRELQAKARKVFIPKPSKPPKETRLKPTAQATASSDRVNRLLKEVVVEEVNPESISLHPRTIMDPLFGGCRWPLGLTEGGERLHCTNDRGNLRPYCSAHKRLAYQASRSPAQIAHDAKLREASQRSHAEKAMFARVNVR